MEHQYETLSILNEEHDIYLVKDKATGLIYVEKILSVYNKNVYEYLMNHPVKNIPKLYDLWEEDDTLTIIEEYINATTLASWLENNTPTITDIKHIIISLCNTLSKLHTATPPIVHRDIKPSNILITPSGDIYLIDYNAAKYSTNSNTDTVLLGTQGYAAPEQYGFGSSSPQSDIYALGILLRELVNSMVTPTTDFNKIIDTCTELNPKDRYASVKVLAKRMSNPSHDEKTSSFLPPGYRSKNWFFAILATFYYILIPYMMGWCNFENADAFATLCIRAGFVIMFYTIPLIICNYRGLHRFLPGVLSHNLLIKIILLIVYTAIIFILEFCILLFALIELKIYD